MQSGKKKVCMSLILQIAPLKKMRDFCNVLHWDTLTRRERMWEKKPTIKSHWIFLKKKEFIFIFLLKASIWSITKKITSVLCNVNDRGHMFPVARFAYCICCSGTIFLTNLLKIMKCYVVVAGQHTFSTPSPDSVMGWGLKICLDGQKLWNAFNVAVSVLPRLWIVIEKIQPRFILNGVTDERKSPHTWLHSFFA